jgi:hypothetical protein
MHSHSGFFAAGRWKFHRRSFVAVRSDLGFAAAAPLPLARIWIPYQRLRCRLAGIRVVPLRLHCRAARSKVHRIGLEAAPPESGIKTLYEIYIPASKICDRKKTLLKPAF